MGINIDTNRNQIIADDAVPIRFGGTGGVDFITGSEPVLQIRRVTVSSGALSGATVTLTGLIPAGAIVFAVRGKVTTTVTGASATDVGITGNTDKFDTDLALAAGSKFNSVTDGDTTTVAPEIFKTATNVLLTAKTSNFTGGVIQVEVIYGVIPAIE